MVGGFAEIAYADIIHRTIKILGCRLMLVHRTAQSRRMA